MGSLIATSVRLCDTRKEKSRDDTLLEGEKVYGLHVTLYDPRL